jgi:hypothetical protein
VIYTIHQSFLQVIASQAADPVVKQLTRNMMNNFDRQYHPTMDGELIYKREVSVGHGNWYIAIHPYFLKAAFVGPCTHHFLRRILSGDNFNQVC